MEARRLVRECGRRGVVGREGKLLRERDAERARDGGAEVGVVEAIVRRKWRVGLRMRLGAIVLITSNKRQGQRRTGARPAVQHEAVAGAEAPFCFQLISNLSPTFRR